MLCSVSNVTVKYAQKVVLDELSCQINANEKIGLIGRNGCGKTTLLKLITGEMKPDSGIVAFAGGVKVRYLSQLLGLNLDRTVREEILDAFEPISRLEQEIREIEHKLGLPDTPPSLVRQYEELQKKFEYEGGYEYHKRSEDILHGLGLSEHLDVRVGALSGGQKTKLSLGKILAEKADLLLLDEPTNSLDLEARLWLENYLQQFNGSVVIVSHDRHMLNAVTNKIFEIENGSLDKYAGNYDAYKTEKQLRTEQRIKKYEMVTKEREKLEDFIRRNISGQKTRMAQGRRKLIAHLPDVEKVHTEKVMHISSKPERQIGDRALDVEGLSKKYIIPPSETGQEEPGEIKLFENLDMSIAGGEKVVLLGPNGSGKTTLFRMLAGDVDPDSGFCKFGLSAEPGFYYQEHENLSQDRELLDELWSVKPDEPEGNMRGYLGAFGFSGDDVFKTVGTLSGGERARMQIAKLLLEKHNCLLLDEPTNHLDIPSIEVLEKFLVDFSGTVLLISHDISFINSVAEKIYAIEDGKIRVYYGNYDDYTSRRAQETPEQAKEKSDEKINRQGEFDARRKEANRIKITRQRSTKRIEEIEARLHESEDKKISLEKEMIEAANDFRRTQELAAEYKQINEEIHSLYHEWDELEALLKSLPEA